MYLTRISCKTPFLCGGGGERGEGAFNCRQSPAFAEKLKKARGKDCTFALCRKQVYNLMLRFSPPELERLVTASLAVDVITGFLLS